MIIGARRRACPFLFKVSALAPIALDTMALRPVAMMSQVTISRLQNRVTVFAVDG
jgi:hypothetical protein